MSRKYPIGIQNFEKLREDGYFYIDKTSQVYELVTKGQYYFLSRPRRFGKSLLISTLEAYFEGKKELFEGLAISEQEKEWVKYPVFRIDFNATNFSVEGTLEQKLNNLLNKWEAEYGLTVPEGGLDLGDRFAEILETAHRQSGQQSVVLVDEYDKPILDVLDYDSKIEDRNRNVLKAFYSTFKGADEHIRFVLLTGVTKFSQVSVFSGFNQPEDISMSDEYETLCGITEEEVDSYFGNRIREISTENGCTYQEMRQMLKEHYDGYHFSRKMTDVYNPFSLLNAMKSGYIDNYWFRTGTPTYLVRLLSHFNENMNEMTGRYYRPEEFIDYKADVERPLPMIYQSGYLTIKEYENRRNRFLLDFPNNEVENGFLTMVATDYLKTKESVPSVIDNMVDALTDGDLEKFRSVITSFMASIPYTMRRKEDERERERYFHYTFYLIMRLVGIFTVYTEKEQSQGRSDCIIETPDYIYIFEFKLDGSAEEALKQIEEKGYAREYEADKRHIYRIGAVFSSETGTISEFMVE